MKVEEFARREICRVGKSLFDRGYVHATAGNISIRLDDGFLVTPTDACLGFLSPESLARMDREGRQLGGMKASKTLTLHRRVYAAQQALGQNTRCVIHTHSSHCVAITLDEHGPELLEPITPYFVMKVGRVPVVRYYRPGDPQAAERVADFIAQYAARRTPIRAVMLSRLGPAVWHDSAAEAMAVLEELEETAKLWRLSPQAPAPLSEQTIAELREHFGARW